MPTIKKIPKKEKTKHSKRSNKSAKYYGDRRWKLLRAWYIREHPLCELCLLDGISKEADEIHHKKEILSGKDDSERYELLLDPDNLLSLCTEHHKKLHAEKHKKEDEKKSTYNLVNKV